MKTCKNSDPAQRGFSVHHRVYPARPFFKNIRPFEPLQPSSRINNLPLGKMKTTHVKMALFFHFFCLHFNPCIVFYAATDTTQ